MISEHEAQAHILTVRLREERETLVRTIAAWYRRDPVAASDYCDRVLDPTGALLGRVRECVASPEEARDDA